MTRKDDKNRSKDFWDTNPCGGKWTTPEEQANWRYDKEPWIKDIMDKLCLADKTVMEIGCGPGLDTIQLSFKAKKVIGLDLSRNSLAVALDNVSRFKIDNVLLVSGDAENLPIKDNSADAVFSYGVLHHTPEINKAVDEIYRVLHKGGPGAVMLYRSYTIQSALISLVRLIKRTFDKIGWSGKYWSSGRVNPSEGTSVMELLYCPILERYSKSEARKMFSRFADVKIVCYQTGFGRLLDFMPKIQGRAGDIIKGFLYWLDRVTQQYLGYYMVVYFKKP